MRKILALLAMMALAGCGGGGGSTPAPNPNPQPVQSLAPQGNLVTPTFSIVIAPRTSTSNGRTPHFVSTATQSVTITLTNPPAGLTPTSVSSTVTPPCTAGSPCNVKGPPSPPGVVDHFSITTFDGPVSGGVATGNALDTDNGTTQVTPVAGQDNPVNVVLMGIPFTIAIAALTTQTVDTAGQTQNLAVTVADHAGQTITGTYSQVVRITDPDTATYGAGPTRGTSLSGTHPGSGCTTTCVDLQTSTDTATLTYNGLAEDPVTLTSSASGVSGPNSGAATFSPTLHAITHTTGGNSASAGSPVGIDLFTNDSSSTVGYSGTEGYHEDGYTDGPYNKVLTTIAGTACAFATLGAANVSNDTVFTATTTPAAPSAPPAAGTCTRVVSDGLAAANHGTGGPQFVVTYTTSSVNASSKHRK
jgi:hypothetical protein